MRYLFALTLLLLFSVTSMFAAKTYTWDGSTSSNWNTVSNWASNPNGATGSLIIDGTYANAPIISSTPSFGAANIDVSGASSLTMTGGTVNVTGSVGIRDGSDFVISGGTMNITGNLYLIDAGSSITVSGGDLNVTGDILMGITDGTIADQTDGATSLNLSSGSISCANLVYDDATGDTHSFNISGGTATVSGDVRSDGEDVIINISSSTALLDVGDDITMTGGNDLLTMTDGIVRLRGDWTNNGSTNLTGGSVRFEGIGSSNITNASGGETFYILSVNKTIGGLNLNDSIIIDFRMALLNGIVTSNGNSVTFVDNATPSIFGALSYIDGPINKIGNETFTFPTGNGIFYNPIRLSSAPNTNSDMYRAQYFRGSPDGIFPILNREVTLATISQLEYWTLDRLIGTSAETVTLNWDLNSLVGNLLDLRVVRWDDTDSEWKDLGNGGTTGDITAGTVVTSSAVTDFSPFTLGSASLSNPLPVELINFDAKSIGDYVLIDWSTAAEINNNRFEIQKSKNGKEIFTIATIDSKADGGNSTESLYYSFHDPIDFDEIAYYQLVQYDHDGTKKEYPFVAVRLNGSNAVAKEKPLVYPNPISGDQFKLRYSKEEPVDFYLFSISGQRIPIEYSKVTSNTYEFSVKNNIDKGIYFLNVVDRYSSKAISTEKLIFQ